MDDSKNNVLSLTKKQLRILTFIYQFRFVTTKHVQQELGQKDIGNADRILKHLTTDGYIKPVFTSENKISKPAIYHLTPKSIQPLQKVKGTNSLSLNNILKEQDATELNIKQCLTLGNINLSLRKLYGGSVMFASKSDMANYKYLPIDLPDAYIEIIDNESKPRDFFLNYFEADTQTTIVNKKLRHFAEYTESKTWQTSTSTPMPSILMIFNSGDIPIPFLRYAKWTIKNANTDELNILATTIQRLNNATNDNDTIWRYIDLDGLTDEEYPYIKLI